MIELGIGINCVVDLWLWRTGTVDVCSEWLCVTLGADHTPAAETSTLAAVANPEYFSDSPVFT